MGGPGSGNPGQARGAGGRFVIAGSIAIATAESQESVEDLTDSVEKSSNAVDENTQKIEENTQEKKENTEETKKSKEENFELTISLQLMVSALNQSTGALLKMVGALEELNLISEQTAESSRKFIAVLEVLTGFLEFVLSMFLLVATGMYIMNSSFIATTGGAAGAATAVGGLAAATGMLLLQFAPLIIFLALVAAGLKVLIDTLMGATYAIDAIDAKLAGLRNLLRDISDFVSSITSKLSAFGDAFSDSSMNKLVEKAGGAVL
jgi:uncharacterized membrane protein